MPLENTKTFISLSGNNLFSKLLKVLVPDFVSHGGPDSLEISLRRSLPICVLCSAYTNPLVCFVSTFGSQKIKSAIITINEANSVKTLNFPGLGCLLLMDFRTSSIAFIMVLSSISIFSASDKLGLKTAGLLVGFILTIAGSDQWVKGLPVKSDRIRDEFPKVINTSTLWL